MLSLPSFFRKQASATVTPHAVSTVSPIVIPDGVEMEREVPAKILEVYGGRLERFDYKTIFYDAFPLPNGSIRLSGPPLANLMGEVSQGRFLVDGRQATADLKDIDRQQLSVLETRNESHSRLSFRSDRLSAEINISANETNVFAGRTVLVTMSQNNRLEWVKDWIEYYTRFHGVDAVLFYDNNSTEYSPDKVSRTIASVSGIKISRVISWPFKYGPHAEKPRIRAYANYSQLAALNHAKDRFLGKAKTVINCDIDELIVPPPNETLQDVLDAQKSGILLIPGRWIESTADKPPVDCSFEDFFHTAASRENPVGMKKWVIAPTRLPSDAIWAVHDIYNVHPVKVSCPRVYYLHFRGISTNWREARAGEKDIKPDATPDRWTEDYLKASFTKIRLG